MVRPKARARVMLVRWIVPLDLYLSRKSTLEPLARYTATAHEAASDVLIQRVCSLRTWAGVLPVQRLNA
jgi:hypothetical protein